jgi:uncharacterized protein YwgA
MEFVLVGGIVRSLDAVGSWCGETHIQKTSYIAKHVKDVPLESEFTLYKHGPFSFDLNAVLNEMRSQNLLSVTPMGDYGSSFELNERLWSALNRAAGDAFDRYARTVQSLCEKLGRKRVAELERITTAVYVALKFPELSAKARVKKLTELKPHINYDFAVAAFDEARVFLAPERHAGR